MALKYEHTMSLNVKEEARFRPMICFKEKTNKQFSY